MVKYGINRIAPHALENAYEVAGDIDDPSLRQQLNELIIEGLIRVGCLMMQEPLTAESRNLLENRIAVFRRANKILGDTVTERRYSIRIARGIDIITEYLSDTRNPYYAVPPRDVCPADQGARASGKPWWTRPRRLNKVIDDLSTLVVSNYA